MSPERPPSRSPGVGSKPYNRDLPLTPSSPDNSMDLAQLEPSGTLEYPQTPDLTELDGKPGFPTRAQYQVIERRYIGSLTPRRQGKALISQALFDRIWDVLHNSDNVKENAQFRFWARKMFTLSKSRIAALGIDGIQPTEQEVLLHDGLLVAVREQIYDLLCYCHGGTNHGGRDKTCALIRKHYTWVPKDLVAQFIKACPTCIVKKCGHSDIGLLSPRLSAASGSPILPTSPIIERSDAALSAFQEYLSDVETQEGRQVQDSVYSPPSTPVGTSHSQFSFSPEHLNGTPIDQLIPYNHFSPYNMAGCSMMREVSLYRGLPNGWQYQNIDYRNAHAEFVEYQRLSQVMPYDPSLGRTRPRVPSIAPLFRPNFEDVIKTEDDESMIPQEEFGSPLSPGIEDFNAHPMSPLLGYPDEGQSMNRSMSIDPFLLALSTSMQSTNTGSPLPQRVALSAIVNDTDIANRTSDAGNPIPRLKLEDLDAARMFQSAFKISGFTSPAEGDGSSGDSSPTSSVRSAESGLSLIAVAGSENSSPTSSAPITPVDEVPNKGGVMNGVEQMTAVEDGTDLNMIIQAVSAFGVRV